MNTIKSLTAALMLILIFIVTYSCVSVSYMKTDRAGPSEITGTYTLLLYGGRYSEDVENVAILDKEGDRYSFEIFAPGYDYTVKKEVQGKEALEEAKKHVGSHRFFFRSRLSRILDTEGNVIGYELRPLYHLTEFGISDILYIDYTMKDNKVITKIRLKYELENREPFLFRGGKGD
ncbi:MAG: hypothetical protein HZB30_05530 [Nitrospirae bacterium]|nr:hypothetical protein [Nitrospirota bacterium]